MIKGLKICGVSEPITLDFIIKHPYQQKFVGFITNYEKSKRFVHYDKLKELLKIDKKQTKFVSVLVDPNDQTLEKIKDLNFDYYQIYDVSPKRAKEIKERYKIKIISALTIDKQEDVDKYKDYYIFSDIILFDSKGYHKSKSFDHKLLADIPNSLNKMIAGNIKIEDIPKFKNKDYIIDLSGALESSEGKKDIKKINKLLNLVNRI